MVKKTWTVGELISKTELEKLQGQAMYGGVETLVYTDTALADSTLIALLDGSTDEVEIILPAATGSGRILAFVLIEDTHAPTIVADGSDAIDEGDTITLTTAFEDKAVIVDVDEGLWITLVGGDLVS